MAENAADDLWVCAAVDLSSRVAMPQQVRAEHLGLDPRAARVLADPVANRRAGQRPVRHRREGPNSRLDASGLVLSGTSGLETAGFDVMREDSKPVSWATLAPPSS